MVITKVEIFTAFRHLPRVVAHPALFFSYAKCGRVCALRKAVEISFLQLKRLDQDENRKFLCGEFHTLIGKMGGYSQECLYYIVKKYKPEIVVETGVYRGISSAFILQALDENGAGELYSIDLPLAKYATEDGSIAFSPLGNGEQTGFAIPDRLKRKWHLILGDSRVELPKLLDRLGQIDLFYHDSQHTYEFMMWEYRTVFPHLKSGSLITSDDISWNSAFKDFCKINNLEPIIVNGKFGFAKIFDKSAVQV
ncbi:MAG: class I SAM-dependent methyltransferase [Candidatus Micrarchaeaceae archaeon]